MRSVVFILALFAALGIGSLRPWLLNHCPPMTQALATCTQGECCPTDPTPAAPSPADCTFCATVVVVPDDLLPGDLIAVPAVQPTAVALCLGPHLGPVPLVPAMASPPGVVTRQVVLLI